MGYNRPDSNSAGQQDGSPLDQLSVFREDPNFFNHKKLAVGESAAIRLFKLTNDDLIKFDARKVVITNPKNGQPMNITVIYPGDDLGKKLVDAKGTRLIDAPATSIFRAIVWLYGTNTEVKDGRATKATEINDIKFIEFGMGLAISLNKMKDYQKMEDGSSVGAFNPDTNRPDYDVRLKVVAGNTPAIPKNYEFEPIVTSGIDPKTKQPRSHPNFGRDTEEALRDWMDTIDEKWDIVREAALAKPSEASLIRQFENKSNNLSSLMPDLAPTTNYSNESTAEAQRFAFAEE